jgi:hypothetical protein
VKDKMSRDKQVAANTVVIVPASAATHFYTPSSFHFWGPDAKCGRLKPLISLIHSLAFCPSSLFFFSLGRRNCVVSSHGRRR